MEEQSNECQENCSPLRFKKLPKTKSLSYLNTQNADSLAHQQSVGRFTLFLSGREKQKTKASASSWMNSCILSRMWGGISGKNGLLLKQPKCSVSMKVSQSNFYLIYCNARANKNECLPSVSTLLWTHSLQFTCPLFPLTPFFLSHSIPSILANRVGAKGELIKEWKWNTTPWGLPFLGRWHRESHRRSYKAQQHNLDKDPVTITQTYRLTNAKSHMHTSYALLGWWDGKRRRHSEKTIHTSHHLHAGWEGLEEGGEVGWRAKEIKEGGEGRGDGSVRTTWAGMHGECRTRRWNSVVPYSLWFLLSSPFLSFHFLPSPFLFFYPLSHFLSSPFLSSSVSCFSFVISAHFLSPLLCSTFFSSLLSSHFFSPFSPPLSSLLSSPFISFHLSSQWIVWIYIYCGVLHILHGGNKKTGNDTLEHEV